VAAPRPLHELAEQPPAWLATGVGQRLLDLVVGLKRDPVGARRRQPVGPVAVPPVALGAGDLQQELLAPLDHRKEAIIGRDEGEGGNGLACKRPGRRDVAAVDQGAACASSPEFQSAPTT
jgi:hypothetical protein